MIRTNNLCHAYTNEEGKTVYALKDITLSIEPGEFVAIIGTNGSGKSTLAKHFNALLIPTEGSCEICGLATNDPNNIWDIRQHVGMVFQNPDNQIVAAVVEEDVAFGPENLGVPPDEIRIRVADALKRVNMTIYAKHGPHLLSGGQKQRIAIAGILAMNRIVSFLTNRRPCSILLDGKKSWIRFYSSMRKALPSFSLRISWKKPSRPAASSSSIRVS